MNVHTHMHIHIHSHIHIHIRTRVCWQAAHLSHIHLEHMRTTCNTPQHTLARRAPVTHTPKALQHNEHTVNTRKCMRARVTGARLAKARGREGMALRDFTSHEACRCVCVSVCLSVCLSVCIHTTYLHIYGIAGLEDHHVLVMRLYTSDSYPLYVCVCVCVCVCVDR